MAPSVSLFPPGPKPVRLHCRTLKDRFLTHIALLARANRTSHTRVALHLFFKKGQLQWKKTPAAPASPARPALCTRNSTKAIICDGDCDEGECYDPRTCADFPRILSRFVKNQKRFEKQRDRFSPSCPPFLTCWILRWAALNELHRILSIPF